MQQEKTVTPKMIWEMSFARPVENWLKTKIGQKIPKTIWEMLDRFGHHTALSYCLKWLGPEKTMQACYYGVGKAVSQINNKWLLSAWRHLEAENLARAKVVLDKMPHTRDDDIRWGKHCLADLLILVEGKRWSRDAGWYAAVGSAALVSAWWSIYEWDINEKENQEKEVEFFKEIINHGINLGSGN